MESNDEMRMRNGSRELPDRIDVQMRKQAERSGIPELAALFNAKAARELAIAQAERAVVEAAERYADDYTVTIAHGVIAAVRALRQARGQG